MPTQNQADNSNIVFHPESPVARLANLGLIAHVHIEPPVVSPSEGKGEAGGGTPQSGTGGGDEGMELEKFVANLGATLALAAHALSSAPSEGVTNKPVFQPRNFTINMNVHTGWNDNGTIMLRPTGPGSKAEEVSQLSISFEPLPVVPAAGQAVKDSGSKP
jgi:hypothetical protein